jgi:adenylate cyclase
MTADGEQRAGPAERAAPRTRAPFFRMPISTALMLGFGLLVFVGVGSVLGVGLWSAGSNTLDLLSDKAESTIQSLDQRLRGHLRPVEEANAFLARLITTEEVDAGDHVQLADYMTGAMAATPQVQGMTFITTGYQAIRVSRANRRVGLRVSDWSGNANVQRVIAESATRQEPYWGNLVWAPTSRITLLNRRAPVMRRGTFIGQLISVVTISELSRFLQDAASDDPDGHPFILYGRDRVLAHPSMVARGYNLSSTAPLPTVSEIDDAVLQHIWDNSRTLPSGLRLGATTQGHRVTLDGKRFAFFYREITGYGPEVLRVGLWREAPTVADSPEL